MIRPLALLASFVALLPRTGTAQEDPLRPPLDRAQRYFQAAMGVPYSANRTRWLSGDRAIYRIETGPDLGGFALVDARAGRQRLLIGAAELLDRTGLDPSAVSWAIAPDSQRILFLGPRGGWALMVATGELVPADTNDPGTLSLRRPQGVASAAAGLLALPSAGGGFQVVDASARPIFESAGEDRFGWELNAAGWSPDGSTLLVWRKDSRHVHTIPIVDYSSALERVTSVPYPKTGTPLPRYELFLVEPATGRMRKAALPEAESYVHLVGWRPGGSEALVLALARDGKTLDLLAVRASDGSVRRVLREERRETFVAGLEFPYTTARTQVTLLPDDRRFLWISERDGRRQLYLYDLDGGLIRQVTRGDLTVQRVVQVTPDGRSALLLARTDPRAPYDLALFRQELTGGALRRLTPEPGMHAVSLSPSRRYYVDLHGTRDRIGTLLLRAVEGGATTRLAGGDPHPLETAGFALPDSLVVEVEGTSLHGLLFTPNGFDPARRYPVVDYIYAGPFLSVVPWDHAGNIFAAEAGALAQMGFVVMLLDARGTPNRDKAFQDHNYGRIGQTEIGDHIAALRQAAATRPYMDTTRVGIYGHSWGGYYALRGMLTAPEFFTAGYAGAPGALEEEALINEPNMGLLTANPEGYRAGSNLLLASRLRGTLRIMHGTSDIDASLSTTMRMTAALIEAGKPFELLIMPGQPHGPTGAARRYYVEDVRRFFVRTLGGPR